MPSNHKKKTELFLVIIILLCIIVIITLSFKKSTPNTTNKSEDKQITNITVPGLYLSDGDFISWSDLTTELRIDTDSDGKTDSPIISVQNSILTTNADSNNKTNDSTYFLSGKLVIDPSVKAIGDYAFYECESLSEVIMPDSIVSIGDHAFFSCKNLTSVSLSDNLTHIEDYAFYSCITLDKIRFPENLLVLGNYSFCYCTSLIGNIILPDSISSIGECAFYSDKRLTSIFIPSSIVSIGKNAFYDVAAIISDTDIKTGNYQEYWGALSSKDSDYKIVSLSMDELETVYEQKQYPDSHYVEWENWTNIKNTDYLSGVINMDYISDNVYMSMKLPGKVDNYMTYRINPAICTYRLPDKVKTCGLGAVYQTIGTTTPKSFQICLGQFSVYVLYDGEDSQWELFTTNNPLDDKKYFQLRPLPWSDDTLSLVERRVPEDKVIYHDTYTEFQFTDSDLTLDSVFHFYGTKEPLSVPSENIRGFVVIYDIWSDTPNLNDSLNCTIGLDQYSEDKICDQAFWGRNYILTNSVQTIIGHSIPDFEYEQLLAEGKNPQICLEMFLSTQPDYRK